MLSPPSVTKKRVAQYASSTPASAADQREHERLGHDLPDQTRPPGAERGANRQLLAASGRAAEHQVGEIRAGDQQHESHRREQHEERPLDVADQLLLQAHDIHAVALGFRVRGCSSRSPICRHLGLRPLDR